MVSSLILGYRRRGIADSYRRLRASRKTGRLDTANACLSKCVEGGGSARAGYFPGSPLVSLMTFISYRFGLTMLC